MEEEVPQGLHLAVGEDHRQGHRQGIEPEGAAHGAGAHPPIRPAHAGPVEHGQQQEGQDHPVEVVPQVVGDHQDGQHHPGGEHRRLVPNGVGQAAEEASVKEPLGPPVNPMEDAGDEVGHPGDQPAKQAGAPGRAHPPVLGEPAADHTAAGPAEQNVIEKRREAPAERAGPPGSGQRTPGPGQGAADDTGSNQFHCGSFLPSYRASIRALWVATEKVSATTRGPLAPQRASWAGSAMTVSRAAARPARSP